MGAAEWRVEGHELVPSLDPRRFTLRTVPRRLRTLVDVAAEVPAFEIDPPASHADGATRRRGQLAGAVRGDEQVALGRCAVRQLQRYTAALLREPRRRGGRESQGRSDGGGDRKQDGPSRQGGQNKQDGQDKQDGQADNYDQIFHENSLIVFSLSSVIVLDHRENLAPIVLLRHVA